MIKPLPHWDISNRHVSFYDTESRTAIEQTARLHAKMQELVIQVNKFIDDINYEIVEYEKQNDSNFDEFKNCIIKKFNDYIETVHLKIHKQDKAITTKFNAQDKIIEDAVDYLKINLEQFVSESFYNALQNGEIKAELQTEYDETTENMTVTLSLANNGGA